MVGIKRLSYFLSLILFLFSFQALAQVSVVSDLDDTLKRTNVQDPGEALINALFRTEVFAGMDTLFKSMEGGSDLYILSASPDFVRYNIKRLMRKRDINPVEIFTRGLSDLGDKEKFKYETITEVLERGYEGVVLLGDDQEADPKIYAKYINDHPAKVLAAYIHRVRGAELPDEVIPYFTAYEVALREVVAGRLSEAVAYEVGEEVLSDMKGAFPDFAVCPQGKDELSMARVSGLAEMTEKIAQAIVDYCSEREGQ